MSTPLGLAEEAEAYLNGSYASQLRRREMPVPIWAWVNGCAHRDLNGLRELVDEQLPHETSSSAHALDEWDWPMAERVLVFEVLSVIEDDDSELVRLQRRVLIPFEMALMDSQDAVELSAPGLVLSVRAALRSTRQ